MYVRTWRKGSRLFLIPAAWPGGEKLRGMQWGREKNSLISIYFPHTIPAWYISCIIQSKGAVTLWPNEFLLGEFFPPSVVLVGGA
jgi:hypothetical protein